MKNKDSIVIVVFNYKGGVAKSANSVLIADFVGEIIEGETVLVEIDKINKSANKIKDADYPIVQLDFDKFTDDGFVDLETYINTKGLTIIDVGSVKLEIFHKSMVESGLYSVVDLVVIPSMDGGDDYDTAIKYLELMRDELDVKEKILFSFNRYNEPEYNTVEEQFDYFFESADAIKKRYGITLKDRYYAIKDSYAFKKSRKLGISVKNLMNKDLEELTKQIAVEEDRDKMRTMIKEKSAIISARSFYKECLKGMISAITNRLSSVKTKK